MVRVSLTLALLALPGAALAQGQEVVVTGRGLDAAPGDAAYDISLIDRDRLEHSAVEPARGRAPRHSRLPAIPPLRRPQRQSDQPGRDAARARRQRLQPRAAAARRRAADRSVRRLDQLAGLRSAAARQRPRDARRRLRRQRPRRAGRHDRAGERGPDGDGRARRRRWLMAAATASTPMPAMAPGSAAAS